MALDTSIVIVSQFSVPYPDGGGSRGGSPGYYAYRYTAREGACEKLAPVRLYDEQDYIMRYMARAEATESIDSLGALEEEFELQDGRGGVAFDETDVSLSDERLQGKAGRIQALFDSGKTVLKTVISFDEDYLRKTGIVKKDFVNNGAGSFRGNIDQRKLRFAIKAGLTRASKHFDNLEYIGVIQTDTAHVHCHLTMIDSGKGHVRYDGQQRGMLSQKLMREIRSGVDNFLDEHKTMQHLSSDWARDKRNVMSFMKEYVTKDLSKNNDLQLILAVLPDDKRLWRAGSNAKSMQRAHKLVDDLVLDLLSDEKSGWNELNLTNARYVQEKSIRDGLSPGEVEELRIKREKEIRDKCANSIYSALKKVTPERKSVYTDFLNDIAQPLEQQAGYVQGDEMGEFVYKLSAYSSRKDFHNKRRKTYEALIDEYDSKKDKSPESRVLRDFFELEAEYHSRLFVKYQYFLDFLPPSVDFEEDYDEFRKAYRENEIWEDLESKHEQAMYAGDALKNYASKKYGSDYDVSELDSEDYDMTRDLRVRRLGRMRKRLESKLLDAGMSLDDNGVLSHEKKYDFEDIKSMDIHHLKFDFKDDFNISYGNVRIFSYWADRRFELMDGVRAYLENTGQSGALADFDVADIDVMKNTADDLMGGSTFTVMKPATGDKIKDTSTVLLSTSLREELRRDLEDTVDEEIKNLMSEMESGVQYETEYKDIDGDGNYIARRVRKRK